MTQIAVSPLYLKDSTLKIAEDNYEKHVSGVTYTPSSSAATWTGLTPTASFSEQSIPTWVLGLDYVQDWETEDSLSRYLLEHVGETKAVEFAPKAGGPSVTSNVTIVPGPIGGAGGAFATGTVSLGSDTPQLVAVGG